MSDLTDAERRIERTTYTNIPKHPSGWGPLVNGTCPACGLTKSLFLGEGGYVTCANLECRNPGAADAVLHRDDDTCPACGYWSGGAVCSSSCPPDNGRAIAPEDPDQNGSTGDGAA